MISDKTLLSVLDAVQRMGFLRGLVSFRGFSLRALHAVIVLILVMFFALLIPALIYIMSLPEDQALLAYGSVSMLYMFLIVILVLSQEMPYRSKSHSFERWKELADLRRDDPMEYIRRLRELTDKQGQSTLEQEN